MPTIYIYDENGIYGLRFRLIKDSVWGLPYFYSWFYSEKELRKIKLDEIQNNRNR